MGGRNADDNERTQDNRDTEARSPESQRKREGRGTFESQRKNQGQIQARGCHGTTGSAGEESGDEVCSGNGRRDHHGQEENPARRRAAAVETESPARG
jgi:hypothetical protein